MWAIATTLLAGRNYDLCEVEFNKLEPKEQADYEKLPSACEAVITALGKAEPVVLGRLLIEGGFTFLSMSDAALVVEQLRGSRWLRRAAGFVDDGKLLSVDVELRWRDDGSPTVYQISQSSNLITTNSWWVRSATFDECCRLSKLEWSCGSSKLSWERVSP